MNEESPYRRIDKTNPHFIYSDGVLRFAEKEKMYLGHGPILVELELCGEVSLESAELECRFRLGNDYVESACRRTFEEIMRELT